jgi:hypothetical protein
MKRLSGLLAFMKAIKSKIGWANFLLEIVSVFIGITIAFGLDNWKESKKSREAEIKTLIELRSGLQSDLRDAKIDMDIFNDASKACRVYEQNFESTAVNVDSLKHYSDYLINAATFVSNSSAYETLKSRGLETVTNDSLRLQIAELYDVQYENIYKWEQLFLYPALFLNNLNYFRDNIFVQFVAEDGSDRHEYKFDNRTKYNTLLILKNMLFVNDHMVGRYSGILVNVQRLIHNLDIEISRLKNE